MTTRAVPLVAAFVALASACALFTPADRTEELEAAVAALHAGGFDFEADVVFRADRYAVCSGLACADVVVRDGRRTIIVAPDAFGSESRLRATLLEIWSRYRTPRPGSLPDLAKAALTVSREGARIGLEADTVRRAHREYARLYARLPSARRTHLPHPDEVGD